jgi:hypothetical protein
MQRGDSSRRVENVYLDIVKAIEATKARGAT